MDVGLLFFCRKDENAWVPDTGDSYAVVHVKEVDGA